MFVKSAKNLPTAVFFPSCIKSLGFSIYGNALNSIDVQESLVTEDAFTSIFLVALRHPTPNVGCVKHKCFRVIYTPKNNKK